jgi:hypothetical protein
MAKPRIFVSSTFYDLRVIRSDLERFIKEMGYEPVLNEKGTIPYGSTDKLEEYCYREIEKCDVLISIIGGRFGSESYSEPYSISQMELKTAIKLTKQIYIFIEDSVLSEYETFLLNEENENVKYRYVNDLRIFKFIKEIKQLSSNNVIIPFSTSIDIVTQLREQWAGLFQRLLHEQSTRNELMMIDNIQSTVKTLNQLVTYLSESKKKGEESIIEILLSNHPVFDQLRKITNTPYRVYFQNFNEMEVWLKARQYLREDDDFFRNENDPFSFTDKNQRIKIGREIFDDDLKLKVFTPENWNDEYIIIETISEFNDNIPF